MKLTVEGMIIYGTPAEIIEYQELYKQKQNEKAQVKLNVMNNGLSQVDLKKVIDDITDSFNKKPIIFGSYY